MKIERHDSESDLLMDLYLPDLIRGEQGIPGPQGVSGPQGLQGEQGIPGPRGEQGIQGEAGPVGPAGPRGEQGERGVPGEKGVPGDRGEKGRDGTGVNILGELERTADLPLAGNTGDGYLIDGNLYVWNPSIGGWLNAGNIKGPKGDTGEKGDPGNPGAKGDKGDTGAQGERGERGDMGEQGPAGERGTQGERGNPGKDGSGLNVCGTLGSVEALPPLSTPGDAYFIGEHLYVFGSEGWIDGGSVKGERGDKGEQGAAGLQGEKGDTGAQGATGAQGLRGEPGAQGEKGDKGDAGVPGATGEQGSKGDKGDPGAQGERGQDGAAGAKGDAGQNGADGSDGISCTHSWGGTVLTVTSASGTSAVDLRGATGAQGAKGDKGDIGAVGAQGEKGDKGDSGSPDTKAQLIEKLNQPGEVVMSRHWVFTSGAGTVSTSDMRFKNHIEALSGTLAALLGAPIFRYHWREQPGVQIGTSAQYWQQHFPELVYEMQDADHTLTLSYERLTVVLLKAIQEQQQLIREQSRRLDALEAAISVNNP